MMILYENNQIGLRLCEPPCHEIKRIAFYSHERAGRNALAISLQLPSFKYFSCPSISIFYSSFNRYVVVKSQKIAIRSEYSNAS